MIWAGRWVFRGALGVLVVAACSTRSSREAEPLGSLSQAVRQAPAIGVEREVSQALKQNSSAALNGARIACGPSECAVVWSTYVGDRIVTGALRLSRDGTMLGDDTLLLTTQGTIQVSVSAGSSG